MSRNMIWAGLILLIVLAMGCSSKGATPNEPVACTMDAKICPDGSAVGRTGPNCEFAPCPPEAPETGAESCDGMPYTEAKQIASSSDCVKEGSLKESHFCNNITGTWWIDLGIQKQGCSPACVINVDTKQAEINWRCTGLIAP